MNQSNNFTKSILMLSVPCAKPQVGKPGSGAQALYAWQLAKQLNRSGHHVDLVTRCFEDLPEFNEVGDNFRVWRIPFAGHMFVGKAEVHNYLFDFARDLLARTQNQGRQYSLVYSLGWDGGPTGQKIAEELGIPHVHTPYALAWQEQWYGKDTTNSTEKQRRFAERVRQEFLTFHACDHIIAISQHQAELLQKQYNVLPRHLTVIPPGIDVDRFSPVREPERQALRRRYGLQGHDLLTVGSTTAGKGYDYLIQAMPIVLELAPDARLIAAVTDADTNQRGGMAALKELAAQCGVANRIKWIEHIAEEDRANYYRAASVFALPLRDNSFGVANLEAMACGTPTVVTVQDALSHFISFGKQALLAGSEQPGELGAVLAIPLLYPAVAQELSVTGARFARRHFSWQVIARCVLAVLDGVQRHKGRQRRTVTRPRPAAFRPKTIQKR